jgi:SAM-dependent methyltransferase
VAFIYGVILQMADSNNQTDYWNKVASYKNFTHPIDIPLLKKLIANDAEILDYGCGYGRLTSALFNAGFTNITGLDSSSALIQRGLSEHPELTLLTIQDISTIPFENNSLDLILLFAVLTCIPANGAQVELISRLYEKLKPGGIIYISDYYLQINSAEKKAYETLNNDPMNFGVFSLVEGATFRHHSKEWIPQLLQPFEILQQKEVEVFTMNGHPAKAFQILARK